MRHLQLKFGAILFFALGLTGIQAQEVITTSGGNASVSDQGSVSWSVGQVVYTTYTGTTGSVAQGVQQSFEISVVSGIEEARDIDLLFSAYPNPATDYLILRTDNFEVSNLSYQLYDNNGKLLEREILSGNETIIDMSNFVPATYFLKVTGNNKEVKTFKIIKD
jgi:hypothetical protein